MLKVLKYLGCIGEVIISLVVIIALLSTFPYVANGVYQQLLLAHGFNYFALDASVAVLFFGVLLLCVLSIYRAINRFDGYYKNESVKTHSIIAVIIFLIVGLGVILWTWLFGKGGYWKIAETIFILMLFSMVIFSVIEDYKIKTKKKINNNTQKETN